MLKEANNGWPAGVKRTKPRALVLSVLENAEKPMSAMEIYTEIEKAGSFVWLSTVYRILELFLQKDVVLKAAVSGSDMAVYERNHRQHRHYAVCIGCHKIIPMESCPVKTSLPELSENAFQVTGHKLEIYGYCSACSSEKGEPGLPV